MVPGSHISKRGIGCSSGAPRSAAPTLTETTSKRLQPWHEPAPLENDRSLKEATPSLLPCSHTHYCVCRPGTRHQPALHCRAKLSWLVKRWVIYRTAPVQEMLLDQTGLLLLMTCQSVKGIPSPPRGGGRGRRSALNAPAPLLYHCRRRSVEESKQTAHPVPNAREEGQSCRIRTDEHGPEEGPRKKGQIRRTDPRAK